MSFNSFQSYRKSNGLLNNQPYHINSLKKPATPNAFMNSSHCQRQPNFNINHSCPHVDNCSINLDNKSINENFVKDLREALREESQNDEFNEDPNLKIENNNDDENNLITLTFKIPTCDTSTEKKTEANNLNAINTEFEELDAKATDSTINSEINSSFQPLLYNTKGVPVLLDNSDILTLDSLKFKEEKKEKEESCSIHPIQKPNLLGTYDDQDVLFTPKMDMMEDEKKFYIVMDLPGMTKEHVNVEISESNMLEVTGERKLKKKHDRGLYYAVNECAYGKFEKTFAIPENVNVENIQAKMENGVLEIILNKKENLKKKSRIIQIQ